MELLSKTLKLFAIVLITISVILFSASLLLQDKVADIILGSFNNKLSTKLEIRSFRLSFLKKFPKASLELKDVLVHSSSNFNYASFKGINTDTLLAAKFVSVEFSITDIIIGNYNIERIGAKDGKINLYSDLSGFVNYDISVKNDNPQKEDLTINLDRIYLKDIKTYYNNQAAKLIITGIVKTGKLKSRISGKNIDFNSVAKIEINRFLLSNTVINKTFAADLDLTLQKTKDGILFKKGLMTIDDFNIDLDGFVSSENLLDLNIKGHNLDLARIQNYLPEKYIKLVSDYDPSGMMVADCKIIGPLTRTKNPHIEINYVLKNGHIDYGKSDLTINNLSFAGHYTNGAKNNFETSSFSLKEIRFKIRSSEYTGALKVSGFNNPKTEITFKGRILPEEVKEFFDIKKISLAKGSVDVDLNFITNFWPKDTLKLDNIIDLESTGSLVFNSLSLGLQNDQMLVSDVNGNLAVSEVIKASNFSFLYKGQKINIDGEFRNLPEWLSGRPVQMIASADVTFNRLIPDAFKKNNLASGKVSSSKKAFALPRDILLDINFKIDSLDYKTFSSTNIAGTLNYKPRLLTFSSLTMSSLNGMISGSGLIVQNSNKSVISKSSFNVTDIDVNKAFRTFHNFGQDFIKAENLSGSLSGSFSLLLPMDSMLNPQIKSLTAEGKYLLINGALINFEPVKQLSSFIELSELENIHFKRFENDFFIRNNFLYMPQMDIKSTAVDLSVNGKHSFDNDYEYHVKVLLSEILSKKRKKNKSVVTEFGLVQDDGLGRTSILLKIAGKGEELKVGYDLKAAGDQVKNNIKTERQTMKSILNQEYGWYKGDSSLNEKPVEKKSRFRITWEENDSTEPSADPPGEKKR